MRGLWVYRLSSLFSVVIARVNRWVSFTHLFSILRVNARVNVTLKGWVNTWVKLRVNARVNGWVNWVFHAACIDSAVTARPLARSTS